MNIPGQRVFTLNWPDARGRWVFDLTADIEVAFAEPVDGAVPSMTLFQTKRRTLPRIDKNEARAVVAELPAAGSQWSLEQLEPLVGSGCA